MDIAGEQDAWERVADIPLTGVLRTERGVFQVAHGMDVVGVDGAHVGRLRDVRMDDILVHRSLLHRDVYVPFEAIKEVHDQAIVLTVPADQVDRMGWPHPPLLNLPTP